MLSSQLASRVPDELVVCSEYPTNDKEAIPGSALVTCGRTVTLSCKRRFLKAQTLQISDERVALSRDKCLEPIVTADEEHLELL